MSQYVIVVGEDSEPLAATNYTAALEEALGRFGAEVRELDEDGEEIIPE